MNLTALRQQLYAIGSTVSGSKGFYYDEAPDNTLYPFIVYHLIDDTNNRIAVNAHTDNILMQFTLFDKRISTNGKRISSVTIEDVTNELITKLNAGTIAVPGYGTLYFKRTLMTPSRIIEEGNYWNMLVRYELYLTNQ